MTVAAGQRLRRARRYYDPKPEYWDVPLMRNGDVIERPADHRTLTRRYTDEAVRFIDANATRPFFLYLAHSLPHIPLARSADFVRHSAGGIYGDVVEEIDWSTGRVLDALRPAGIDRRTLVVFTSDNGPWLPFDDARRLGWSASATARARRGKAASRTPAIFWWPGTVRPSVGDRHRLGDGSVRDGREARQAPSRRPTASSTASILRARLTGSGPSPRRAALLLLGQRAAGGPQGRLQGALHHQRLA